MKKLISHKSTVFVLIVNILVICQPGMSMSCKDLSEVVVTIDFKDRQNKAQQVENSSTQAQSTNKGPKTASEQTQETNNVVAFKIPKLDVDFKLQDQAHYNELATNLTKEISSFEADVIRTADNYNSPSLQQNKVWQLHSTYKELAAFVKILNNPQFGYPKSTVLEVNSSLAKLNQALAKTQFFEKLEKQGHTLVPKANQLVKRPLPEEFLQALSNLNFILPQITVDSLARIDSRRRNKIEQMLFNRGDRKHVFKTINEYLEILNSYLASIKSELDARTTDLTEINQLINRTEYMLASNALTQAIHFNKSSFFKSDKNLVERYETERKRFEILAFFLKNPIKNKLQTAKQESKNSLFANSEFKAIIVTLSRGLRALASSSASTIALLQPELRNLASRLKSNGFKIDNATRDILISYLNVIKDTANEIPSEYKYFGDYSKKEIQAAKLIKEDINEIVNLITN